MRSHLTFEAADSLLKDILKFLRKQGGVYSNEDNIGDFQRIILIALARGHYYYDGRAFVCWRFVNDMMHVDEAAGDLSIIRRELRKHIKKGLSFYRHNRNKSRLVMSANKRC